MNINNFCRGKISCSNGKLVRCRAKLDYPADQGANEQDQKVGHRDSHSLDEAKQRQLLLHVYILCEGGISPTELVHFRVVAKLLTIRFYYNFFHRNSIKYSYLVTKIL
ncbi:hypothetical protein EVAR_66942_1, partial [Eumeta japonica]